MDFKLLERLVQYYFILPSMPTMQKKQCILFDNGGIRLAVCFIISFISTQNITSKQHQLALLLDQ